LRTSRQIYAETALYPFTDNTFALRSPLTTSVKYYMKSFRKYQSRQIRTLRFELLAYELDGPHRRDYMKKLFEELELRRYLPGLQRIHMCVFPEKDWAIVPYATCETFLQSDLAPAMQAKGYEVTLQKMEAEWYKFEQQ